MDLKYQIQLLERQVAELQQERNELAATVDALRKSAVPNEHGKNRYGVDVSYFRKVINRELNRSLMDFKPDELARVFARLSITADDTVLLENEFIGKHLCDVRAEAGRDGFIAGAVCARHPITPNAPEIKQAADNYAASVKAGE